MSTPVNYLTPGAWPAEDDLEETQEANENANLGVDGNENPNPRNQRANPPNGIRNPNRAVLSILRQTNSRGPIEWAPYSRQTDFLGDTYQVQYLPTMIYSEGLRHREAFFLPFSLTRLKETFNDSLPLVQKMAKIVVMYYLGRIPGSDIVERIDITLTVIDKLWHSFKRLVQNTEKRLEETVPGIRDGRLHIREKGASFEFYCILFDLERFGRRTEYLIEHMEKNTERAQRLLERAT